MREWHLKRRPPNRRFRRSFHFDRLYRFGLVGRGNAACAAEQRSSGCPDKDLAKHRDSAAGECAWWRAAQRTALVTASTVITVTGHRAKDSPGCGATRENGARNDDELPSSLSASSESRATCRTGRRRCSPGRRPRSRRSGSRRQSPLRRRCPGSGWCCCSSSRHRYRE
jgi:hypothetical protein